MKFTDPHFQSPEAACDYIEALRWGQNRACTHCGVVGHSYETGRAGRSGVARYRCGEKECRKDFTVTTGTVMESSHIPLNKWLMGFYMMSASKKGVSAHQLHRALDITYKSAWFMCHRIRLAMEAGGLTPLGGEGKIVEADETYFGKVEEPAEVRTSGKPFTKGGKRGVANKRPIVALVERGGQIRTFHVAVANKENVQKIVRDNVAKESRLHTDESRLYTGSDAHFAAHETVKHGAGEYARGDVHVNSAEGYFGVFKKGMKGIYQHCDEKHLHRYLSEFDFRHNTRTALGFNDLMRTELAVKGAEGKRLTYRRTNEAGRDA